MPGYLRLCLRSMRRNAGLPVVLVTAGNLRQLVPDLHPAYPHLSLPHRADYLRAYLLHHYGGIYLDADTIVLRSLAGLFGYLDQGFDAVGYDGAEWFEYIGVSDIGPVRPQTDLTKTWYWALVRRLDERLPELVQAQQDIFRWTEILKELFVPVTGLFRDRVSTALLARNPSEEELFAPGGRIDPHAWAQKSHILILNNAIYGERLRLVRPCELLRSRTGLAKLLCYALGWENEPRFLRQQPACQRRAVEGENEPSGAWGLEPGGWGIKPHA